MPEQDPRPGTAGSPSFLQGLNRRAVFDELRRTAKVSTALRKSDGVHVRVVSRDRPAGAASAEPSLEDAFLYTMSYAA